MLQKKNLNKSISTARGRDKHLFPCKLKAGIDVCQDIDPDFYCIALKWKAPGLNRLKKTQGLGLG